MHRPIRPLTFRRHPLAVALSAALAVGFAVPAADAVAAGPVGKEFRVNTENTFNNQHDAAVAMDADGDFVVAWTHEYSGYYLYSDIRVRRYNSAGQPQGDEISISGLDSISNPDETEPSVAMDPAGNFVVSWTVDSEGTGAGRGVRAQRFNAAGVAQGSRFKVNTVTTDAQDLSAVAMDPDGNFVVTWVSANHEGDAGYGVYAKRFSAAGIAQGGELHVNNYTASSQRQPAVAMDVAGGFVIVWQSFAQDGADFGIYAARYFAGGSSSSDIHVNTYTTGAQVNPAVAFDAGGDFLIAWHSSAQDGNGSGVYGQRFSTDLDRVGVEFRVNSYTTGNQSDAAVALAADGGFQVAWESNGQDGSSYGIYTQRYAADGSAQGGEMRVNSYATGQQRNAAIALDADGDSVVAWASLDQDSDDLGVYAQRYRGDEIIDLDLSIDAGKPVAQTGEALSYTARISNLHAPRFDTGLEAIDAALSAAFGTQIVLSLPPDAPVLSAPVTTPAGVCLPRAAGYLCRLNQALPAGAQARVDFSLTTPATPGSLVAVATVQTQSLDDDPGNNRDRARTRIDCTPNEVQFLSNNVIVNESASSVAVTVRNVAGTCNLPLSVQVEAASGSATAGLDFIDTATTLDWAPGQTSDQVLNLQLLGDSLDEIDERVLLSLSNVSGGRIGAIARAGVRINDNDAPPRANFTSRTQTLGENTGLATVTVQLSEISGRSVVVPFSPGGTAANGEDYVLNAGALTLPAGTRSASFDVEILDDSTDEPDETLVLSLGAPTGAVAGSINAHSISITDNDEPPPLPTVSFTTASSSGDETITRSAVVQLSAPSAQTVTVPFSVSGSASLGSDYSLNRSSPLTFNPGVTQIGIQTVPVNDVLDEPSETVILTLGTPTGATLGATTVNTRTILDNDP